MRFHRTICGSQPKNGQNGTGSRVLGGGVLLQSKSYRMPWAEFGCDVACLLASCTTPFILSISMV